MKEYKLDRRDMLSAVFASVSVCALSGVAPIASVRIPSTSIETLPEMADFKTLELVDEEEIFGLPLAEQRAWFHAPFRAEFLAWLQETSKAFALPVATRATSASSTELYAAGLHPALHISLDGDTDINVFVEWEGISWDILASMDVYAEELEDGAGWTNRLFMPEARQIRSTQEACWRQDGFEWLLDWFNNSYMAATHLVLYEGEGWTAAHLARDGVLLGGNCSVEQNGPVRHLLPLHETIS